MTQEEKINYMKIATQIVGFNFRTEDLDLFISIYEFILQQKGKTNLENITNIKEEVKNRTNSKAKEKVLDKLSNLSTFNLEIE